MPLSRSRVLLVFAVLLSVSAALLAQSNFGAIVGVVKDVSGGVIASATVKLTEVGTNASVTIKTDSAGVYSFPGLKPVVYDVAVSATGFQTTTVTEVKVDTAKTISVDAVLQPGSVSTTVTVTGGAPVLET